MATNCFDTLSIKIKSQPLRLEHGWAMCLHRVWKKMKIYLPSWDWKFPPCLCSPWLTCGIRNCSVRSLIILGQRPRQELQKAYGEVRVSAGFSLSGSSVLSVWDTHLGSLINCCLNTSRKPYSVTSQGRRTGQLSPDSQNCQGQQAGYYLQSLSSGEQWM